MLRLLIWLLLGYIVFKIIKGFAAGKQQVGSANRADGEVTHQDPICGKYVAEEDAVVGRLEEERLYFCSMHCLETYQERITTENHKGGHE